MGDPVKDLRKKAVAAAAASGTLLALIATVAAGVKWQ